MEEPSGAVGDGVRLVAPDVPLETSRLELEPLTEAHATALFAGLADERLYRYLPQNPPASPAALADRYRRLARRRSPNGREAWLNWAMRVRSSGAYVGTLEATVLPDRTAFVAYTVLVPHQRQRFAREGLARIVAHLFADYRVTVVIAEIDTRNAASIALVEGLGFARVATRPSTDVFKGADSDEYRYELRAPS